MLLSRLLFPTILLLLFLKIIHDKITLLATYIRMYLKSIKFTSAITLYQVHDNYNISYLKYVIKGPLQHIMRVVMDMRNMFKSKLIIYIFKDFCSSIFN